MYLRLVAVPAAWLIVFAALFLIARRRAHSRGRQLGIVLTGVRIVGGVLLAEWNGLAEHE